MVCVSHLKEKICHCCPVRKTETEPDLIELTPRAEYALEYRISMGLSET